ncbi:MAG: c-type cytochrome [Alphaproteobacteria bacterium]|nr:c-type cytochrome [Alphaproteobacteria bacterium]MBU0798073.1 c-type cytochrome [Alphaproteobacteria bacterium]MBU0888773.1 c-type cytochrome [Alphaproteobacteria bacterium]MBU1812508.1 c-type cytochrome [Alphaproteobacteria bacterium]MBU2091617.1 c-type cytochrome [Alphaproteobacteria bacterium]
MASDPYKRRLARLEARREVLHGGGGDNPDGRLGPFRMGRGGGFLLVGAIIAAIVTIGSIAWDKQAVKLATGPNPEDAHQVQLGRSVYFAHCAYCHGDSLEGKADWQLTYARGGRPPTPLDAEGGASLRSDQALFDIVKQGGQPFSPSGYRNDMPAFAQKLSDAEIWAVIAYMQKSWPVDILAEQKALNRR